MGGKLGIWTSSSADVLLWFWFTEGWNKLVSWVPTKGDGVPGHHPGTGPWKMPIACSVGLSKMVKIFGQESGHNALSYIYIYNHQKWGFYMIKLINQFSKYAALLFTGRFAAMNQHQGESQQSAHMPWPFNSDVWHMDATHAGAQIQAM